LQVSTLRVSAGLQVSGDRGWAGQGAFPPIAECAMDGAQWILLDSAAEQAWEGFNLWPANRSIQELFNLGEIEAALTAGKIEGGGGE
jgi:hypothetical protein